MSAEFCLSYNTRRTQNSTAPDASKYNNRYDNLSQTLNPYTKINPTTNAKLTQYELDMRRKVEILKYDKSTNVSLTKKQSWTQIVKGSSQRRTYSQAFISALRNGTASIDADSINCKTISTSAGIPGTPFYLQLDPNVPLYKYITTNTYATQNVESTLKMSDISNYDILSNEPFLTTIYIGPAIDDNYGNFTLIVPIGLNVTGNYQYFPNSIDVSGTFTVKIPVENISVSVKYGGADVTLNAIPIISFDSSLSQISGKTPTILVNNASFSGKIYIGNMTISNLGLAISPGFIYEISIQYIPLIQNDYINNFTATIITNIKNSFTNANKKNESGMVFTTTPPTSSIAAFSASLQ
jgi:hypothetical protein